MSVVNCLDWFVEVFVFFLHLIVHIMGKLTLNLCYFDLHTVKILQIHKEIQSTADNSNLQGKQKKARVIGSSSYRR